MERPIKQRRTAFMRWVRSCAVISFIILCAPLSFADSPFQTTDIPYPHAGIYGGASSWGYPFVSTSGGPLIDSVVDGYAHFPFMILPATPLGDMRKDIPAAIRAKNPKARIFAYVMASTMWCGNQYNPSSYFSHYWNFVNSSGGGDASTCSFSGTSWLHMQDGSLAGDLYTINVNLAKRTQQPDGSYKYPIAEGIADLIYNDVYLAADAQSKKIFDGIFFDVYCDSLSWMEGSTPATKFDYQRAGYGNDNSNSANRDAFMAGWTAGFYALANRLRSKVGDNSYPITGNCGQGKLYTQFNGWMRENFPYQNGGDWNSNMFRETGGYLAGDQKFRKPTYNYIFTAADPTYSYGPAPTPTPTYYPYSSNNRQKARFGLGSACLGEGFAAFAPGSASINDALYHDWFYDEYAVDLTTGYSSTAISDLGWLGNATSYVHQQIWLDNSTELAANNGFETDTSSWSFRSFAPSAATLTRDTTGAPEGTADAHIHTTAVGGVAWYINLASNSTFTVNAYTPYAITFWAKASTARPIEVVMTRTSDNYGFGYQYLPITTEWQRYQVVMIPQASGTGQFRFDIGKETGDIWFDDIHLRQGITNAYRRDFSHGIVLVNPTNYTMTVPLEKEFRKIKGIHATDVNSGDGVTTVTSVQVGANDALFLLNKETMTPLAPLSLTATLQ